MQQKYIFDNSRQTRSEDRSDEFANGQQRMAELLWLLRSRACLQNTYLMRYVGYAKKYAIKYAIKYALKVNKMHKCILDNMHNIQNNMKTICTNMYKNMHNMRNL